MKNGRLMIQNITPGGNLKGMCFLCFNLFKLELERCWFFLFLQMPPHKEKGLLWACVFGGFSSPVLGLLLWAGIMAGVCGGRQPHISARKSQGPKEVEVPGDLKINGTDPIKVPPPLI